MAQAGIASRRKAEDIITAGQVTVNGKVAGLGDKADPEKDRILVQGKPLKLEDRPRYILLHKKRGVVSSTHDPEGRPTVLDELHGHYKERLYPVGRLDIDSEGLVLMTNDGDLANRLTHPRYGCEKTYKVLVEGRPTEETLDLWRRGLHIEATQNGDPAEDTAPCKVKILDQAYRQTWLRVVMKEGKKRQIRRIADHLGHPVLRLIRTHIGNIELGHLKIGEFRELSVEEVRLLKSKPIALRPSRPKSPPRKRSS
jgi:pseudouridine synthase